MGSRDGWGGCKLRLSIVPVETLIPVWAAPWAVERECEGKRGKIAEALLWPEPVEWDAESDFTAWTSGDGKAHEVCGARSVRLPKAVESG